jgi:hypothetical protein
MPGESQEELEDMAIEDQLLAQYGYVPLKEGQKVFYKHIDELTCEESASKDRVRKDVGQMAKRADRRREDCSSVA